VVTTTEVEMAYRLILGREPESEKVVAKHAVPNRTLDDLRRSFLTSEEFGLGFGKLKSATPNDMGCKPLVWSAIQVDVDVSAEHLTKMVERIEREFKHMGETEPHWSVISAEQFKSENIQDNKPEFFESGSGVVDDLRAAAARCGVALDKLETCFELGCGLGRSTIWLADQFKTVVAADISAAHLELAARILQEFDKSNVELHHINTLSALKKLDGFDVFFSIIVLQHNPPPLIAFILRTLLQKLRPGGIGYFQVPTYTIGYRFDAERYLAIEQAPGVPEMHVIPQSVLLRIIEDAGCQLLEMREDGAAGLHSISNRLLVQRT
jgi:SAM-dependent methyltransferase